MARYKGVYVRETATFVVSLKFRQGLRESSRLTSFYVIQNISRDFVRRHLLFMHMYENVLTHVHNVIYIRSATYVHSTYAFLYVHLKLSKGSHTMNSVALLGIRQNNIR